MALDLHQSLVSAQYLQNKFSSFEIELLTDDRISFRISFRSISCEQRDRISPNFIYAFILTISQFGLLHIIVRTFVTEHVESSALDT